MKGIIAISGMALANTCVIQEAKLDIKCLSVTDTEKERQRLEEAKTVCAKQLEEISAIPTISDETVDILDFQLLMLEDTDYFGQIEELITEQNCCEFAVRKASDSYIDYLQNISDNDYLRERSSDIADLANRLISTLQGVSIDFVEPEAGYIVVANDLTPSQVATMSPAKLKGIVLEKGGLSSHCVIIAKSLDIPCIIQVKGLLEKVADEELLLLDAVHNQIVQKPNKNQQNEYEQFCEAMVKERTELKQYIDKKSLSSDGFEMKVLANISSAGEAELAMGEGAEGIGLFRSELVYMAHNEAPSEETQFSEYSKATKVIGKQPLIIRTLDVGGDKEIGYLDIPKEENPFLGYRAIRYCLGNRELFKTQLSSILRASEFGDVNIMLPMITNVSEIIAAKVIINEVKTKLLAEGHSFNQDIKVGIMIETPAAVIDAHILAVEVDFFSIGTNDLTQYLYSADRGNPQVQYLNSCFQPALLRAINQVAKAANNAEIDVDICGTAGEVLELVPLFLAMNITAVSVSIPNITRVRRRICKCNKAECEKLLQKVLECRTETEIKELLAIT